MTTVTAPFSITELIEQHRVQRAVLPDALSALMRLAVEDVQYLEKLPWVRLDMSYWVHTWPDTSDRETCTICWAGAMLIRRVANWEEHLPSIGQNSRLSNTLRALDEARRGNIARALAYLSPTGYAPTSMTEQQHKAVRQAGHLISTTLRTTEEGYHATWSDYLAAANILEAVGL